MICNIVIKMVNHYKIFFNSPFAWNLICFLPTLLELQVQFSLHAKPK